MINRLPTDPSPNWFFSPLLYFALNLQTGILSHGTACLENPTEQPDVLRPYFMSFSGSFRAHSIDGSQREAWKTAVLPGMGQISNILIWIA